jgi:hypothetical protein
MINMSSECEYNWYWKISACSTEYEVSDSFASLTRQQTSYSGSSGRYFRYQSIHIQITYAYTITALERDQYEVLWNRVQQYWTRRSRVQYCCTQLHKYRIKGILFSILTLSGSLSGEPDRVSQMMVLIKTVSETNSPLFCLSVIYIQKSLKRWKKVFLQLQKRFRIKTLI